jgi:predicted RNase H-like HicB family nuclease
MDFHTVILRKSQVYWVSLCLENGLVGQGITQQEAMDKLQEAMASFEEVYQLENDVYSSPISIQELHEFLNIENHEDKTESYELRKVYA